MVQINQLEGAREPCRELQHAREKYFYILIHFAQTNVNYLPLECNIYKTNHAIWCWMLRHSNQVRNNKEKYIKKRIVQRKSWLPLSDLKHCGEPSFYLSGFFLFFSAALFAFVRLFWSSKFEVRSSDSYSWTPNQPSFLWSTICINFCLLRISCWASCTKVLTWLRSSALALILERRLS